MRNKKVSRNVRQKYFDLTKDPVQLPIFCVSNSEYTTHTLGYDRTEPPRMGVEITEIPKLRAFLYGLPAVRKFRAFEHHRKMVLPSLLNNLEMTCSQTKLMRREELYKILSSAQDPVSAELHQIFENFTNTVIIPGIATIKTKKVAYAQHATTKVSKWISWKSPTHKAFCLKRGNWSTKAVGKHDWNREMLEPLLKDAERDIAAWDDPQSVLMTTLSEKLGSMVSDLVSQLDGKTPLLLPRMKLTNWYQLPQVPQEVR